MTNGIYSYYDKKNQYVVYIGQDSHIDKKTRHKQHLSPSYYNKQHINRTLQNNPNRYTYFKLFEGNYTQDEIDNFEKEAIKLFKTYKYDYPERSVFNFTPGGDFCPSKVPEIAEKMSTNNARYWLGKSHSELTKEKMSTNNARYWLGKFHSESTKEKMSQSQKGKKNPNYRKTFSQETRDKMSQARNTTGYYRVCMQKSDNCKQGFIWRYQYRENGKYKSISSVDIKKLETKVKNKGLKWKKIK